MYLLYIYNKYPSTKVLQFLNKWTAIDKAKQLISEGITNVAVFKESKAKHNKVF